MNSPSNFLKFGVPIALVLCWLGFAVLFTGPPPADAPYPSKPIRLIVSYPPGGVVDRVARTVSGRMSAILGQPVVVENKGGAAGVLATDQVAKAEPDGHTLLITLSSHSINPALYAKLPFDTERDFVPIINAVSTPQVLVVHPSVEATTVAELAALARQRPGELMYASPGNGSPGHLAGVLFNRAAGVEMIHVPYRGTSLALPDVLTGRVPVYFVSLPSVAQQIELGQLRALAVTGKSRSATASRIPTMHEAGIRDYVVETWVGFFAPAKTPGPVVARLYSVLKQVLSEPDVIKQLTAAGIDIISIGPDTFREQVHREIEDWKALTKAAKITLE